jgi:tRNA A37 threonylcarbamoyltransferase TsaD
MRILALESSCDESAVAVYDDVAGLLAHEIYSQIDRIACRRRGARVGVARSRAATAAAAANRPGGRENQA